MTPETLATWMQRRGYDVVRGAGCYWYNQGPRVYQALPYHWQIQPDEAELRAMMVERGMLALRYSTPAGAPLGARSYHVTRSGPYRLEGLPQKARYDVRRALKQLAVEPIALDRLADEGWRLRAETLARQGRSGAEDEAGWRRLCLSAAGLPGAEAWGAVRDGRLVASLLAFRCEGCASILYQQSDAAGLASGANNALAFVVTSELLGRPGVQEVFYGLHSLDAPPTVDEFKFRMGYIARPVRQRVVFHPLAAPFVGRASLAAAQALLRRLPGVAALSKAEGLLRFYLDGRLPGELQPVPDILRAPTLAEEVVS